MSRGEQGMNKEIIYAYLRNITQHMQNQYCDINREPSFLAEETGCHGGDPSKTVSVLLNPKPLNHPKP